MRLRQGGRSALPEAPLHDRPYCFAHDPERAADAAEARRLGGARRRKEGTIAIAYDLPGLDSVEGIRRVFEIARTDLLGLDNTINRGTHRRWHGRHQAPGR